MPDMLVRLYSLPDAAPYYRRVEQAAIAVRRAEPWDRLRMREFARTHFPELWGVEADRAYSNTPISCYLATRNGEIVGFAAYEVTRRGYFGPTGVREDLRGDGVGSALLFRCLQSMYEMGYAYAVIGGVGPAEFYEKVCRAFVIPGSETGIYGSLNELRSREPA
jgi:predicted GNAT family acetyltransferase